MITITGLQKIDQGRLALDIASLTIPNGECWGLLSPLESGTRFLAGIALGWSAASAGQIVIDPPVAVLPRENGLYGQHTAAANLHFQAQLLRVPSARVDEVLGLVGMADQGGVRVKTLSPGLRRRLALARALLGRPANLIAHAPFHEADPDSAVVVRTALRGAAENGAAVLIIAEQRDHIERACHSVVPFEEGRSGESYHPENPVGDSPNLPFKIPARDSDRVALLNPADVLYVTARDGGTFLVTAGKEIPTRLTMQELEARLGRAGFFRAHRAFLVNLQYVDEIARYTRDSFTLVLNDADRTKIPLSKQAAKDLETLLGY